MNSQDSSNEISERFALGIKKFNDKEFFDCHDILEDIWFEIRGSSRSFYQGLIHLAVGFHHMVDRDNPKGALSQLNKGIEKLRTYEPEFQGIELMKLLNKIEICISEINKLNTGKEKIFNQKLIPKLNFEKNKFNVP